MKQETASGQKKEGKEAKGMDGMGSMEMEIEMAMEMAMAMQTWEIWSLLMRSSIPLRLLCLLLRDSMAGTSAETPSPWPTALGSMSQSETWRRGAIQTPWRRRWSFHLRHS